MPYTPPDRHETGATRTTTVGEKMESTTRSTKVLNGVGAAFAAALCVSTASAETLLERGTYLMQGIVACGNCHTTMGPQGPVPGMEMAGGLPFKEAAFTAYAPNITPDKETGIGAWTDAEIIAAIREGKRPDGTTIGPPMPIALYRGISDRDAQALVAYLRAVPPVRNEVPKSEYSFPLLPAYGPPVGHVADVDPSDTLAYGAYLAGPAGHCIECHSPPGPNGAPDLQNGLGAGGYKFHGPWGVSVSPNITPKGLGAWSDADIKQVITTGVRPNGARLMPPMGFADYANIRDEDLDATSPICGRCPRSSGGAGNTPIPTPLPLGRGAFVPFSPRGRRWPEGPDEGATAASASVPPSPETPGGSRRSIRPSGKAPTMSTCTSDGRSP